MFKIKNYNVPNLKLKFCMILNKIDQCAQTKKVEYKFDATHLIPVAFLYAKPMQIKISTIINDSHKPFKFDTTFKGRHKK